MDDISVSSEPEWFSSLTKHSFVWMASFPVSQSDPSVPSCCCTSHVKHSPQQHPEQGQCWGMCSAGTGAAPWHSPLLCWDRGPAVCMETMPAHEPLPWEPAAPCSTSSTVSAGLCQPGKLKKVIPTQSNDVLSSQLPCLKIYLKEELIVPKWSSLFCLYKQSDTLFGLFWKFTQRKKLLFSLSYNQKWEILSDHIPSEKIYLEQEYPIYWDWSSDKCAFLQTIFGELWSMP